MVKLIGGIGDFYGEGTKHEVAANLKSIQEAVKAALPNAPLKINDVTGKVTAQLDSETAAKLKSSLPKEPETMRAAFGSLKAGVNGNVLEITGGTISGMKPEYSQSLKLAVGAAGDKEVRTAADSSPATGMVLDMKKLEKAGYTTSAADTTSAHPSGVDATAGQFTKAVKKR